MQSFLTKPCPLSPLQLASLPSVCTVPPLPDSTLVSDLAAVIIFVVIQRLIAAPGDLLLLSNVHILSELIFTATFAPPFEKLTLADCCVFVLLEPCVRPTVLLLIFGLLRSFQLLLVTLIFLIRESVSVFMRAVWLVLWRRTRGRFYVS